MKLKLQNEKEKTVKKKRGGGMDREGAIKKDGKRQIGSRGTQTHTQFALVPLFSFAAAAHTHTH